MEFSVNELNSQMFQHLVDPFGICQGRIHHQGGPYMLFPPVSACTIRHFKGLALSLHISKISARQFRLHPAVGLQSYCNLLIGSQACQANC